MVVQVGLPSDKAQYIHRIGRTARAGRGGCGVLLLAEFEKSFWISARISLSKRGRARIESGDRGTHQLGRGKAALEDHCNGIPGLAWLLQFKSPKVEVVADEARRKRKCLCHAQLRCL